MISGADVQGNWHKKKWNSFWKLIINESKFIDFFFSEISHEKKVQALVSSVTFFNDKNHYYNDAHDLAVRDLKNYYLLLWDIFKVILGNITVGLGPGQCQHGSASRYIVNAV